MKPIGPLFSNELERAGLLGLPFSWGADGLFNLDQLTDQQKKAVLSVYEAHDPYSPAADNLKILAQIEAIEQATMVPRITREGLLKFAEVAAETEAEKLTAAGTPTTAQDLLSQNIGYQKTKAVDDQIRALRSRLV